MKLIGHDTLFEKFKILITAGKLSHGYIFFGEPAVGKFSFARRLAAYLEAGQFEEPASPLTETVILRPDETGIIGIDSIRDAKYFLTQKPVYSSRRVVIVDEAEKLTSQAQHALLKITEEPPPSGLIILIATNAEVLLATIQSRLQKVYFPRVSSRLITSLLIEQFKISESQASRISKVSFGRPGRAVKLAGIRKQELGIRRKKELIEKMTESNEMLNGEMTEIIAELATDPVKNYKTLKSILNRLTKMSQFNTNKRLQLESALWSI